MLTSFLEMPDFGGSDADSLENAIHSIFKDGYFKLENYRIHSD